jgi:hypothetical protein
VKHLQVTTHMLEAGMMSLNVSYCITSYAESF